MKPISLIVALVFSLLASTSIAAAEPTMVLDVWPEKPADDDAAMIGEEKFFDLKINGKSHEVAGRPVKWMTNVTKPTLTVFRPAPDKDCGASALICPGGGYHNLAWDLEGTEIAEWLNSLGVTGIVLKYRCPRRPADTKGLPAAGPLKDAQRAVSLVRSKARDWGLDPHRIGMIGFSAGGHLVGSTATQFEHRSYAAQDEIDQASCRPDFAIPVYSGYFMLLDKETGTGTLSPTIRLPANAPPLFFVHASDDPISEVEHSIGMHVALKRAGIHSDLHVYASGGHGFGVRPTSGSCSAWTQACADWLLNRGFLKRTQ